MAGLGGRAAAPLPSLSIRPSPTPARRDSMTLLKRGGPWSGAEVMPLQQRLAPTALARGDPARLRRSPGRGPCICCKALAADSNPSRPLFAARHERLPAHISSTISPLHPLPRSRHAAVRQSISVLAAAVRRTASLRHTHSLPLNAHPHATEHHPACCLTSLFVQIRRPAKTRNASPVAPSCPHLQRAPKVSPACARSCNGRRTARPVPASASLRRAGSSENPRSTAGSALTIFPARFPDTFFYIPKMSLARSINLPSDRVVRACDPRRWTQRIIPGPRDPSLRRQPRRDPAPTHPPGHEHALGPRPRHALAFPVAISTQSRTW